VDKAIDAIDGWERDGVAEPHIGDTSIYVIYVFSAFSIIHVNRFLNCNVNAHFSGEIMQFLKV
jgi:hypothetical protein